ncbi:MAG: beta-N-acetylhexosaminidase [Clostridiales bacterium]|nr:beta-N-acetylhexosaminidase [Clostridiales bacterium]
MTIQQKIGQRLVGGFPGTTMSEEFIQLVRQYKIANVILFRRNIESNTQLEQLCRSIQTLVREETGHDAFIAIDQEGGMVNRLSPDGVNLPGAMALAATNEPENAYQAALLTAGELRALGVNFNLAPVADINNNPDNPVIGARSYGDTPDTVERFASAAMRGYLDGGVMAAAKHFPGHGDTAMDSHVSLPMVDKPREVLEACELRPFKALSDAGCPAIMTTHILFPALEPERVPATMSRAIVTGLLKEKMGFKGLVVSDCMEMQAIQKDYGTAKGVSAAIAAGVDLVFVCHTASRIEEAARTIREGLESDVLSIEEMDQSVEKILAYKEKYCLPPVGVPAAPAVKEAANALRTRTITLVQGKMPPLGNSPFFCGCADYRMTGVQNEESNIESFAGFMASRLSGTACVVSHTPSEEEIAAAVEAAKGHSALVVNTYNSHLFAGQQALVKALSALDIPMVVVALASPYDLQHLAQDITAVAAWDYTTETLEALIPVLSGRVIAPGKLPITFGES